MAVKTGNPALYLPAANELTRIAREGLVAEFDMLTFDGTNTNLLLDQSGNGNNALFSGAPTKTSQGVSFNGTYWADFTISPALGRNYTYLVIVKSSSGGFVVFGSWNVTDQRGSSLRFGSPSSTFSGVMCGSTGNTAQGPLKSGSSAFGSYMVKMSDDHQARIKGLTGGVLGYGQSLRGEDWAPDDRTLWRIGGAMQTSGSDHTVNYLPLDTGTIAYIMLWARFTSENQDLATKHYVMPILAARGITSLTV